MREKIGKAVKLVTTEAKAGRLHWTREDVQKLIKPYPKHGKADAILARIAAQDEPEVQDGGGDVDSDSDAASAVAEGAASDGETSIRWSQASDDESEHHEGAEAASPAVAEPRSDGALAAVRASTDLAPLTAEQAEAVQQSSANIDTFKQCIAALKECGAVGAVVHLENEVRKEDRRQRCMRRE